MKYHSPQRPLTTNAKRTGPGATPPNATRQLTTSAAQREAPRGQGQRPQTRSDNSQPAQPHAKRTGPGATPQNAKRQLTTSAAPREAPRAGQRPQREATTHNQRSPARSATGPGATPQNAKRQLTTSAAQREAPRGQGQRPKTRSGNSQPAQPTRSVEAAPQRAKPVLHGMKSIEPHPTPRPRPESHIFAPGRMPQPCLESRIFELGERGGFCEVRL